MRMAHIANLGRLTELLRPGSAIIVSLSRPRANPKTSYDLVLVEADGVLVSMDARLTGALLQEAIEAGSLAEFGGYSHVKRLRVFMVRAVSICYLQGLVGVAMWRRNPST